MAWATAITAIDCACTMSNMSMAIELLGLPDLNSSCSCGFGILALWHFVLLALVFAFQGQGLQFHFYL